MKSLKKKLKKLTKESSEWVQGVTPMGEKESCSNCFKHPCYYHVSAGENSEIFCDNYEYLDFHISFGAPDIKKLDNKGLKNV